MMYEGSLKRIRDERGWYYTGRQEGIQEGSKKKAREIARNLLKQGLDHSTIAEITGLSPADLEDLA
jgi:predicted transposase/invertase (TIGR01784 family)